MAFFSDFDGRAASAALYRDGVVALPEIVRTYRPAMLREVLTYDRELADPIVRGKSREVAQNYHFVPEPGKIPYLNTVRMDCNKWLLRGFGDHDPALAPPRCLLDSQDVHIYKDTSVGVGWHRDQARYSTLAVIIVLDGDGDFMVADDHDGTGARRIEAGPGDVILLAMQDFPCMRTTPTHGVFNITARTTLSFRSQFHRRTSTL